MAEHHDLVFCSVMNKFEVVSGLPIVGFLPDVDASILTIIDFYNIVLFLVVKLTVSAEHVR